MRDDGCTCSPCTTPGRGSYPGAPGWPHCAACCYGTLVAEYDHACPVGDHAEMAVRQHGPAHAVLADDAGPAPSWAGDDDG